jgi:hypothetical protein
MSIKTVNVLTEASKLIKTINQLKQEISFFDDSYTKNLLMSKVMKLQFDLYLQQNGLKIYDLEIYSFLIKCMKNIAEVSFAQYDKVRIYLKYCNHKHEFTPTEAYVGVALDLFNENEPDPFFSFMLSPYIGEFNQFEVGLSIQCSSPNSIWLMKNYNIVQDQISQKIKITNLSPGDLYMYVLSNKIFNKSLSTTSSWYDKDRTALQLYAKELNKIVKDLNLALDEQNLFSWNTKYKIKQIVSDTKKLVKFPGLSSFLYE